MGVDPALTVSTRQCLGGRDENACFVSGRASDGRSPGVGVPGVCEHAFEVQPHAITSARHLKCLGGIKDATAPLPAINFD